MSVQRKDESVMRKQYLAYGELGKFHRDREQSNLRRHLGELNDLELQTIAADERNCFAPAAVTVVEELLRERGTLPLSSEQVQVRRVEYEEANWTVLSLTRTPIRATLRNLFAALGGFALKRMATGGRLFGGFLGRAQRPPL